VRDPAALAARYLAIDSPTGEEEALAAAVAEDLSAGGPRPELVEGCVVWRNHDGDPRATLLAGHLDTVSGVLPREAPEGQLAGRGAVDMKGGLAVAVALASSGPGVPLTVVAYPGEEGPLAGSGLARLRTARPELLAAHRGVLLEPTGGFVELGCQGVVRARVHCAGRRAHVARAWMGENAIAHLAPVLERLGALERREPIVGGVRYREAIEPVGVRGGIAGNVVPDAAVLELSYRFAPDIGPQDAVARLEAALAEVLSPGERLEVTEAVSGATSDPALFDGLIGGAFGVRAKLGWTDVAQLAWVGVPAVNFGPGDPELAHTDREVVEVAEVRFCAQALWRWLHADGAA